MKYFIAITCIVIITAWLLVTSFKKRNANAIVTDIDTALQKKVTDSGYAYVETDSTMPNAIHTGAAQPAELISFAETLIGTPYVYASTDPAVGFDCSGFITYVFNHFNIQVPRSSVDFTNVPYEVPVTKAKPADLILFTGTDSTIRIVGHMGIIVQNINDTLQFIHSTSGKANSVTITPLNDYYKGRFVKIIRIFPQNGLPSAQAANLN